MTLAASILANFRASNGTTATFSGTAYPCTTAALSPTTVPDWLPEGTSSATNTDLRVFAFSPSVFTGSKPLTGATLTWNGADYRVGNAYPSSGGTTWRCECYRQPAAPSSNPAPREYRPPDAA